MTVFDTQFLQKLEYLSLLARRKYHGQMMAQRATRQLGSGIEFADHQPYSVGDDFRYLDWNAYARHGDLLLKRFHEERDLRVDLLIDASQSMAVGAGITKFQYACQVGAALAYLALAQMDRVEIVTFADDILSTLPETRGKAQILTVLKFLDQQTTRGVDTCLDAAVAKLTRQSHTGGIAILISDFLDPHGCERALDRLRYHQFEVYLVHVHDTSEADPKLLGDYEMVDIETGATRLLTIRQRDLQRYRAAFQEFATSLETFARQHGMSYLRSSTDVRFDELILKTMRRAGWLAGG